jgi:hypothetical protein
VSIWVTEHGIPCGELFQTDVIFEREVITSAVGRSCCEGTTVTNDTGLSWSTLGTVWCWTLRTERAIRVG